MDDYQRGMIDGLELALVVCNEQKDLSKAINKMDYYLKLMKENRFEKMKIELGIL